MLWRDDVDGDVTGNTTPALARDAAFGRVSCSLVTPEVPLVALFSEAEE